MKSKEEINELLYKIYDLYIYEEEMNKPNQQMRSKMLMRE